MERSGGGWIDKICKSLSDKYDSSKTVSWLILYLGRKEEDQFISVVKQLGYPLIIGKWIIQ